MSESLVGHSVDLSNLPQSNEGREADSGDLAERSSAEIDVSASAPESATSAFAELVPSSRPEVVDVGIKSDAAAHKNPLHTL